MKMKKLVNEICESISWFKDEIPVFKKVKCGNYLDHRLEKVSYYAKEYLPVIKHYKVEQLYYKK